MSVSLPEHITRKLKQRSTTGDSVSGNTPTEQSPLLPHRYQDIEPDDGYHEASFTSAVFNLSTTIVGAGIMALPATMKVLGLPLGLLAIALGGILTNASLDFMIRFSRPCKARSYGGLMADAFGKVGRTLTQLCVIINNGGVLIVYMIIIGDVLSGTAAGVRDHHTGVFVEWAGGPTWWNGRVVVLFATTIFILLPLVSFRHVDSLKVSSALSIALAVVFVVITAAVCILKLFEGKIASPRLLPDVTDQASFWRLFTVVPVMVTAYICHNNLHPIASELKGSWEDRMPSVCRSSLILCSSIYLATALFGYLLFGEHTYSDILSNFDADLDVPYSKVLGAIVRVSYAVHVMLVFPLLNFSLRLNLDSLLFRRAPPLAEDSQRFTLITGVVIGIIFFGSTLVPNIWVAFEFTGSTVTVLLGFIFPGAIVIRDTSNIATKKDKVLAAMMIVLAVLSSASAVTTNLFDLFKSVHSSNSSGQFGNK